MKRLSHLIVLGCMFFMYNPSLYAQVSSHGFNYQAVARDINGNPIPNKYIIVEATIRAGGASGTIVWQDGYKAYTNEFGLFTLVIGEGITTAIGALASFNDIDWGNNDYYIQIRVDYGNGLVNMGTSRLNYVPYAKVADSVRSIGSVYAAGDVTGSFSSLKVTGIQGNKVTSVSPANGQILKWNSSTSTWELSANNYIAGNGLMISGDTIINITSNSTHTGDAVGSGALTVVAIQGNPVSSTVPSTNQFLSWNGTSWAPSNVSPGGVGGSGYTNRVTFWTGSNTIGSDTNFYWDNTNKKLGIGTNYPSQQLSLTGNLSLPSTTITSGIIFKDSNRFIHSYGSQNVFMGENAGNLTVIGPRNVGIGYQALYNVTTGGSNVGVGYQALYNNSKGAGNTAIGLKTLTNNTTGDLNTAIGASALYFNTTGTYNTAVGMAALSSNTTGSYNTVVGNNSLFNSTTASWNTAFGTYALAVDSTGEGNTSCGFMSLYMNTSGSYNTAQGNQSLYFNNSGNYNTALGYRSLYDNNSGNYNTALGYYSNIKIGNLSNATAIGYNALASSSDQIRLGNDTVKSLYCMGAYTATTNTNSANLYVDKNGQIMRSTASNGSITGTGSTGQVTFWNGSSSITGDTNFYWDNTNKRLGLGTTNPGFQLDLTGNINLPNTTSTSGVIYKGDSLFIHNYGTGNTFIGMDAGNLTMTGIDNTALGYKTLYSNTNGNWNTAIGNSALFKNTWGVENTATGYKALYNNMGVGNTANGYEALLNNVSGGGNTAIGLGALYADSSGSFNTACGIWSLAGNTTGSYNAAYGIGTLEGNTSGNENTAIGNWALGNVAGTGSYNAAIGVSALEGNSTGSYNTASGADALDTNKTGNYNSAYGYKANVSSGNLSNATAIGYGAIVTASNYVRIGNTDVTIIGGQCGWSTLSDMRFKQNIKDIGVGLEFVMKLRPVEYQTKTGDTRLNYGFIAQELLQLVGENNTLVNIGGDEDKTLSVRHTDLIAPVVKAIQEQQQEIMELKNENQQLKSQMGQIMQLLKNN